MAKKIQVLIIDDGDPEIPNLAYNILKNSNSQVVRVTEEAISKSLDRSETIITLNNEALAPFKKII